MIVSVGFAVKSTCGYWCHPETRAKHKILKIIRSQYDPSVGRIISTLHVSRVGVEK